MEAVIVSFLTKDQFVNSNDDLSLRKCNITLIGALFNLFVAYDYSIWI